MLEYKFASQEEAKEVKEVVDKRLDFVKDDEGWPDRKHLSVSITRACRVYVKCDLRYDRRPSPLVTVGSLTRPHSHAGAVQQPHRSPVAAGAAVVAVSTLHDRMAVVGQGAE
uniref:Uncharacterized protein n=1 Tax=Vitrella brassicaformis TaxID=1169539 RepID=A0A7S1P6P6_9ALVE|mmetsp:Transcript_40692/g.101748  ORF Transcript_40692/g.101748 Transcript_40692/m.101748 type:complete len:112 (+) Transcript_40692:452-787(+)